MTNKYITVLGEKPSGEMGITDAHEHIFIDMRTVCSSLLKDQLEDTKETKKDKIILQNRGEVIYKCFVFEENLYLDNTEVAVNELKKFKNAKGKTMVDPTLKSIGRNPDLLKKVSLDSGVDIIMGCGNYQLSSWTEDDKKRTEEQMTNEILDEFVDGVGESKIRPGVIGEIAIMDIDNPLEIKSLKAAGKAQRKIGCSIIIHPPIWEKKGHKILDILEEVGVPFDKVILAHCDHCAETIEDMDYFDSLAKRGANISYDGFGNEFMGNHGWFLPTDNQRINAVIEHIKRGNINNLLMSSDICLKILLTEWGGWGYAHVLEHIIPRMKKMGITDEQIEMIIIENPKRILCF